MTDITHSDMESCPPGDPDVDVESESLGLKVAVEVKLCCSVRAKQFAQQVCSAVNTSFTTPNASHKPLPKPNERKAKQNSPGRADLQRSSPAPRSHAPNQDPHTSPEPLDGRRERLARELPGDRVDGPLKLGGRTPEARLTPVI